MRAQLVLMKICVEEGESEKQAVEATMRSMGWKPKIAEKLTQLDEPEQEEILMLCSFDPNRYYIRKLEGNVA